MVQKRRFWPVFNLILLTFWGISFYQKVTFQSGPIIHLPKWTNNLNYASLFICTYFRVIIFYFHAIFLYDYYCNYRPNIRPNIRPSSAEYSVSADTNFFCIGRSLMNAVSVFRFSKVNGCVRNRLLCNQKSCHWTQSSLSTSL